MPTTQRTNTYTTRSDRQFDLWRIIILCSLAYILLPASIILCPERISAFSSNEGMDLPFVRTKIAGQMCHDAILTRKMRTTCVDISVLKTCSAGGTSFGGRTTRSRNPSRSASLNLTRGHTNLAITSEKGNAIHEPST